MTDLLARRTLRQRTALAIWAVNLILCLALLAFVLR